MDDAAVGSGIKRARENVGISARQMAKAISMDPAAYSRSEAGTRAFKATEIVDIANQLDLPLDTLVQRAAADTVVAGRRAQAAGEDAVAAVTEWLTALDRALSLAIPPEGLLDLPLDAREELHGALTELARTVLPRVQTVAVTPGLRTVLDDVLRVELPRLISLVEAAPVHKSGS